MVTRTALRVCARFTISRELLEQRGFPILHALPDD
jgi:hypothetical protein